MTSLQIHKLKYFQENLSDRFGTKIYGKIISWDEKTETLTVLEEKAPINGDYNSSTLAILLEILLMVVLIKLVILLELVIIFGIKILLQWIKLIQMNLLQDLSKLHLWI